MFIQKYVISKDKIFSLQINHLKWKSDKCLWFKMKTMKLKIFFTKRQKIRSQFLEILCNKSFRNSQKSTIPILFHENKSNRNHGQSTIWLTGKFHSLDLKVGIYSVIHYFRKLSYLLPSFIILHFHFDMCVVYIYLPLTHL